MTDRVIEAPRWMRATRKTALLAAGASVAAACGATTSRSAPTPTNPSRPPSSSPKPSPAHHKVCLSPFDLSPHKLVPNARGPSTHVLRRIAGFNELKYYVSYNNQPAAGPEVEITQQDRRTVEVALARVATYKYVDFTDPAPGVSLEFSVSHARPNAGIAAVVEVLVCNDNSLARPSRPAGA
jgi:hypothetical protein